MRFVAVLCALTASGCGGCSEGHERVDARTGDAPTGDARDADAGVDAADDAPDAAIPFDPSCAGVSPSCTTAPTTFVPITAPTWPAALVRLDDTLYVSTYDLDASQQVIAGRVIAADLTSTMQTTLLPGAYSYVLAVADGWVYAAQADTTNGSIWRFRPGVAPVELISGRPSLRAVTADATHFYWAENSLILRRPIAGGLIEPVMQCAMAQVLIVDDTYLYCAQFGQDIYRGPKNGVGNAMAIAHSDYPFTHMTKCSGVLYATNVGEQKLFAVPTPSGPISTFANPPGIGRFLGVTATAAHYYTTSYGGVYKIDRYTAAYQLLAAGEFTEITPATWNGQLLFFSRDLGVRRCVD